MVFPVPENEHKRLSALYEYGVLDTPPEPEFDQLTQLIAEIVQVPIALIGLLDAHRQWFKSCVGLTATEAPRDQAFCAHTVLQPDLLIIEDTLVDSRFKDNPLVTGEPYIRFYAGASLITATGFALGTLCVLDVVPRQLTPTQALALKTLAQQVVTHLELRQSLEKLQITARNESQQRQQLMEQNQALQTARQVADQASRAKGDFLAKMSHEIRTPMNAVIGMMELLQQTPLTPLQQDYVNTAAGAGKLLLNLINDILSLSKIESGKLELAQARFNLRRCVQEAVDLFSSQADEKGLTLQCHVEPDVPTWLIGDVNRLQQILVNLLGNAFKFTHQGGITVSVGQNPPNQSHPHQPIKGHHRYPTTSNLHIQVQDTGIGIPADQIDQLFHPFTQVNTTNKPTPGGTGLGLAISKQLCELMGGQLWVESQEGVGSTFHATISAPISKMAAKLDGPLSVQGKSILVVDDDEDHNRYLSNQLRVWGATPLEARTWKEALLPLEAQRPLDGAFINLALAQNSGLALVKAIRSRSHYANLPIVLLTLAEQQIPGIEGTLGVAQLKKPVNASNLGQALEQIFDRRTGVPAHDAPTRVEPLILKPIEPVSIDAALGQRHPLSILLAEDNPINQKVVLKMLQTLGYSADIAENGVQVLEALRQRPYDVVFMDIQMPEMDGLEATRRICQEWSLKDRPRIIALTANALDRDREMCFAAGMDDYMSKPIRLPMLANALQQSSPKFTPEQPS